MAGITGSLGGLVIVGRETASFAQRAEGERRPSGERSRHYNRGNGGIRSLALASPALRTERAQLREQVRRAMRGLAEVREVETLVLPVGVAGRVFQSEQQRGHPA